MTQTQIDPDFESTVAHAMLDELEAYLKSDIVFWQAASTALGDRMPRVTIGGLLESLLRAEAAGVADAPSMRAALDRIRSRRRDGYLSHAEREARSRLDAWAWYLDDYDRKASDVADYYPNEVRARLKAELLLNGLEEEHRGQAERARAGQLDARVRASFAQGDFVLDERLKPQLPSDRFWWLYGRLPDPDD